MNPQYHVRSLPFASDGMRHAVIGPHRTIVGWFETLRSANAKMLSLNNPPFPPLRVMHGYNAKSDDNYFGLLTLS